MLDWYYKFEMFQTIKIGGTKMHPNIKQLQQKAVQVVKENLNILEVKNIKPVIMVAFSVSEKPLSVEELAERTELTLEQIKTEIEILLEKEVIAPVKLKEEADKVFYEVNQDFHRTIIKRIKAKIKKVNQNNLKHIEEGKALLKAGENEYDPYDRLMCKLLKQKMRKFETINFIVSRRIALANLLCPENGCSEPMKKIDLE